MNTEFYEYILRERGRRDVDEDKDDSMCASLPHVYSPAQPARGTVSRRLRSTQHGEIMTTRGKKGKGPKLIFLCNLRMEINLLYLT